ncbi:MAG: hypothetical protein KDJ41_02235 [Hyphomicrobiaceae bacterium]|nr:hypothetical protein [Hyphomicrobiaceae bacterium]
MIMKIARPLMILTLLLGIVASSVQPAEAHRRGNGVAAGVAAGLITLGILGAYAHDRRYGPPPGYSGACYKGPRECGWVGARCWINRYGDEVCNRGHYRCWRKTYCD